MRPEGVVFPAPLLDDHLSLFECVEDLPIKHFVSELTVETFTIAIFPGAPRFDVQGLHSCSLEPLADGLGAEYLIDIEITSKPFAEYRTDEWADTELPCAPAIIIGEEVLVEGSDVSEDKVVVEIRKQLGMPPLEPEKKGVLARLFKWHSEILHLENWILENLEGV